MRLNPRRAASFLVLAVFTALAVLAFPVTASGAAATAGAEEKGARINLNSATAEQIETLPGVGPSYARRIVEYREKNGPFKRVEDLLNVQGIGEKTLEKIRDRVSVGSGK